MTFTIPKQPDPQNGDIREQLRFAWLPTRIDDNYVVWLEQYVIVEKYHIRYGFHHGWMEEYKRRCYK